MTETDEQREARRAERRAARRAFVESWLLAEPVYVAACSDNGWGTDVFHAIDINGEALNFGDLTVDDEIDEDAWRARRQGRLAWTPMCGRARVWLLEPPIDWQDDDVVVDGRRRLRPCSRCLDAVWQRAHDRADLLAGRLEL